MNSGEAWEDDEPKNVRVLTLDDLEEKVTSIGNNAWAAEKWVSIGRCHILCGLSHIGKSSCGFDLWISLASGEYWMGSIPTKRLPIYLCDFENPQEYMLRHLKDMCGARGIPYEKVKQRLFVSDKEELFRTCDGFDVEQTIRNIQFIKETTGQEQGIFVVDSLRAAFGALPGFSGEWEWETSKIHEAARRLNRVVDATGWGCVALHHDNSGGKPNGAIQRAGAFDIFMHLTVPGNNVYSAKPRTLEISGRLNEGDRPNRLSVAYARGRLIATDKNERPTTTQEPPKTARNKTSKARKPDKYLAALREHPDGLAEYKLKDIAGGEIKTVRKALAVLEKEGSAERCDVISGGQTRGGWRATNASV